MRPRSRWWSPPEAQRLSLLSSWPMCASRAPRSGPVNATDAQDAARAADAEDTAGATDTQDAAGAADTQDATRTADAQHAAHAANTEDAATALETQDAAVNRLGSPSMSLAPCCMG